MVNPDFALGTRTLITLAKAKFCAANRHCQLIMKGFIVGDQFFSQNKEMIGFF
jgi:hypothetical protein